MAPPGLDHHLGLGQAEEYLAVEQFVSQLAVEALAVAILPRAAGLDVGGLGANGGDPGSQRDGDELRPIVRPNIGWRPAQDHQIRQGLQHVGGVQPAFDPDRQGFAGELVDHAEHAKLPSIMGSILDEVIGPDVVRPLGAQAHAGAVIQPQPAAFWLFLRDFQPLPSPDPLHPLGVHRPTRVAQQGRDPPVAVAAVSLGQLDDVGGQRQLVIAAAGGLALGGPGLPEHRARATLRHPQLGLDLVHAAPATGGA